MPKEKTEPAGRGTMSIIGDAIHAETIKKEMRNFRLHKDYMLSPKAIENIVITTKPTDAFVLQEDMMDEDIRKYFSKGSRVKHTDLETPLTTSGVYGWDTKPLVHFTDRRFHHPKTVTEITKMYGTCVQPKLKEKEK
ncbi:FAM183A and FAM183B related-domain-containing protein [Gorgonomyces haynaldii]|nr:FAM183A and FAM183B related-domain-containing protein [Gorgonomyces haynaldii]